MSAYERLLLRLCSYTQPTTIPVNCAEQDSGKPSVLFGVVEAKRASMLSVLVGDACKLTTIVTQIAAKLPEIDIHGERKNG